MLQGWFLVYQPTAWFGLKYISILRILSKENLYSNYWTQVEKKHFRLWSNAKLKEDGILVAIVSLYNYWNNKDGLQYQPPDVRMPYNLVEETYHTKKGTYLYL